jgi:hypothetical protein
MGKWKCLWCSKVLEGESFMDLVSRTYVRGEPVHAWENITLVEEEKAVTLVNNCYRFSVFLYYHTQTDLAAWPIKVS